MSKQSQTKMKKIVGVIFILIGLWALIGGVVAITNAVTIRNTPGGRVFSEFSGNYSREIDEQIIIGGGVAIVGLILLIIGIVMVANKSQKQMKRELENDLLIESVTKPPLFNPNKETTSTSKPNFQDDKFQALEKLAKLKDQGVLTEEEFIEEKRKILSHT